ncbi:MAG: DNA polymerase IV [Bacilli bacterium]|nr:DNA polymerase IV [Bacilli bacterium]
MSKIIMHVDLNAFFATAEVLRNPSLAGKPLIVGGLGRRGVVSTASYEARAYGIHSAMPTYQAIQLLPSIIVKPCDFPYYEMLSRSFFAYVRSYSPLVEEASIDECYVDMSRPMADVEDVEGFLKAFQNGLLKQIGLKCSIGVAPTKFLAKMGSDMKKPLGITILRRRDLAAKLYPLPIESCFGIGRKTAPRLRNLGIATIGDFQRRARADDPALLSAMGKFYYAVKDWVNGRGDDSIDLLPFDPKSLGHSETFERDTSDYEEIRGKIAQLSREVAMGAQEEGRAGKTVQLVVKDTNFKSHDKSISFRDPTNKESDVFERAIGLYEKNFVGLEIRLVGVTLQNLIKPSEETVQMSLWNYREYEEMDQTKLLMNELNRRMEKPMLKLASEVKKHDDR